MLVYSILIAILSIDNTNLTFLYSNLFIKYLIKFVTCHDKSFFPILIFFWLPVDLSIHFSHKSCGIYFYYIHVIHLLDVLFNFRL